MSPKTATTIISLIALLTLTLSSAETDCNRFKSVGDALRHHDLPAGLFPSTVSNFSCHPIPNINALALTLQLKGGVCTVTKENNDGVKNVVECQPHVSAIISRRQLTNVKGVAVRLAARHPPFGPFDVRLLVSEITVSEIIGSNMKYVQFYSNLGITSPPFPYALIASEPSTCDAHKNNNHDVSNYGRFLLPLVA